MVARRKETILPFFFNDDQQRLFGCYHGPDIGYGVSTTRDSTKGEYGLVLCYPFGYEYFRTHTAYRQLAKRLSADGFPVLRFDFYGCGDSGGEFHHACTRDWISNIHSAIEELKRRSGQTAVCVVASRLSGALSLMAIADRDDVERIVLWDPVIDGKSYLQELEIRHRQMLRISHVLPDRVTESESSHELLGYPFSTELRREIANIDLTALQLDSAIRILLISSNPTKNDTEFRENLKHLGIDLQYEHLPNRELWDWVEDVGNALLPMEVLQHINAWAKQAY